MSALRLALRRVGNVEIDKVLVRSLEEIARGVGTAVVDRRERARIVEHVGIDGGVLGRARDGELHHVARHVIRDRDGVVRIVARLVVVPKPGAVFLLGAVVADEQRDSAVAVFAEAVGDAAVVGIGTHVIRSH